MPRLPLGRGVRAVEAALLAAVDQACEAGRQDPALLSRPVRVIVPSRSLRQHLLAGIVRSRGRPVAGLMVQTLAGVAEEILERAGRSPRAGTALFPIFVRRAARKQPELASALDDLVDAYGAVEAAVRDLLDAGFEPEPHSEALEELLAERGPGSAVARAVVRCAVGVFETASDAKVEDLASRWNTARLELEERGAEALPSHAVFVHGFADATGRVTDLLCTLQRELGAEVYLDEVPDLLDPARAAGGDFLRRLREPLARGGILQPLPSSAAELSPPAPLVLEAAGAEAEVRAVATRVRKLLDDAVPAEEIGVVARAPADFLLPLRRHFERLAIPFSALGIAGPGGALRRRAAALLAILADGEQTPVDRWLDARADLSRTERADLRLALRHRGLARLADAPALPSQGFGLPVRGGAAHFRPENASDGSLAPISLRRRLETRAVRAAASKAESLRTRLGRVPDRAPGRKHLDWLRSLLEEDLGWQAGETGLAPIHEALNALDLELPDAVTLDRDEFLLIVRRALEEIGAEPAGGAGGGVAFLGVMQARARSFEHLFVLGLNRDVFPHRPAEDPLLPDALREPLTVLLPDLPVKRRGIDEERHLFAQLLSASPNLTLSWQSSGDDGRERAPSVFLERLRWAGRLESEAVPQVLAGDAPGPYAPHEAALRAGLLGNEDFEGALQVAAQARGGWLGGPGLGIDPGSLTAARLRVRDELDRPPGAASPLGPYFGFVGSATSPSDPRTRALFVTTLENTVRCPWRAFVERFLKIESIPDPLEALPEIDALRLGNAVHAALEAIARRADIPSADLHELPDREPRSLGWPGESELEAILRSAAENTLAEEGTALPGLVEVLVRRARPFLARARELDWRDGSLASVLAVESLGVVSLPGREGAHSALHFRADRVDATGTGLRLTDYKTGKPLSQASRPDTRRRELLQGVGQGVLLQACAYALALPHPNAGAQAGRYLYLRPGDDPEIASYEVRADDEELRDAFLHASNAALDAVERGCFFPRLLKVDDDEAEPQCERCEVKEACLFGDSGARSRLRRFVDTRRGAADLGADEEVLLAAWDLRRVGRAR